MNTPLPHCTECNAEIYESMGACHSGDILAVMLGAQDFIRQRCGLCALHPYVAKRQVFDPHRKKKPPAVKRTT